MVIGKGSYCYTSFFDKRIIFDSLVICTQQHSRLPARLGQYACRTGQLYVHSNTADYLPDWVSMLAGLGSYMYTPTADYLPDWVSMLAGLGSGLVYWVATAILQVIDGH